MNSTAMNSTAGNITSKKFEHYLGSSKEYITRWESYIFSILHHFIFHVLPFAYNSEFLSLFLVTVLISVVTSYMLVRYVLVWIFWIL